MQLARISYKQSTATLTVTVEDQNGAVVATANIALINAEKGTLHLATTRRDGTFFFTLLPPGRYSVTATAAGFAPMEIKDVVLSVNHEAVLTIPLRLSPMSRVMDQSQFDQAHAVATVVDRRFGENIPVNGKSFQSLSEQIPAVVITITDDHNQARFCIDPQRVNANDSTINVVSANIVGITTMSSQKAAGTQRSAKSVNNNKILVEAMPSLNTECRSKVLTIQFENRIVEIERISVRLFGLAMLLLALVGPFLHKIFDLIKFVGHLWTSS